jgi:hypothetical protein
MYDPLPKRLNPTAGGRVPVQRLLIYLVEQISRTMLAILLKPSINSREKVIENYNSTIEHYNRTYRENFALRNLIRKCVTSESCTKEYKVPFERYAARVRETAESDLGGGGAAEMHFVHIVL